MGQQIYLPGGVHDPEKPMPTSDIPKRQEQLHREGFDRPLSQEQSQAAIAAREFDRRIEDLPIPKPGKDTNLPVEKKRAASKRPTTRKVASKR